ncbi:MAG: magnesium transporter CorA family protein [Candidatus Kuenenbacteria bacterium]
MVKTIKHNKFAWHHLGAVDDEAILFLEKNFKFHPLDIKDIQGEAEESKIDIYQKYLFLIIQFPLLHRDSGHVSCFELAVFLGEDFLITIQKNRNKTMRNFYYRLQNNPSFRKTCFNNGPGHLLYQILKKLYTDTKFITNYISKKVRILEDSVYSDEINENTAREIAYLRKKILSLKRIFEPQREVLETLSKLQTNFTPIGLNVYFDDIDDYVNKVWNFLDNQKYAMKDLLEVHDSLLTHTTSKIIKILTVFSVSMLPLTLLSGIYGMNIHLPFASSPGVVWAIFFALLALILIVALVLRKRKWL